jgi:hypothetical protein
VHRRMRPGDVLLHPGWPLLLGRLRLPSRVHQRAPRLLLPGWLPLPDMPMRAGSTRVRRLQVSLQVHGALQGAEPAGLLRKLPPVHRHTRSRLCCRAWRRRGLSEHVHAPHARRRGMPRHPPVWDPRWRPWVLHTARLPGWRLRGAMFPVSDGVISQTSPLCQEQLFDASTGRVTERFLAC